MLRILRFVLLASLLCVCTSNIFAEELKREEGLSVHVIPKSVADIGGEDSPVKWGFMVSQTYDLKPPNERPVFQKPEELLAYYDNQSKSIRKNGIWVVITHPESYSDREKESIEKLKKICKEKGVSLYICRGMNLPDGWVRQ
ncbi:MAG: hypothetical protein HZB36_03275 [Candidatus Omnitrophica bacterium]|nr:hypothetical protein [Candidatus Omnitrophota bacterium]